MLQVTPTIDTTGAGRKVDLAISSHGACFVDWGDGSAVVAATQTLAPNDATGAMGTYTATKTYTKDGPFVIKVTSNDVQATLKGTVGKKPFPNFDPIQYTLTPAQRWAREKQRADAILGVRRDVG